MARLAFASEPISVKIFASALIWAFLAGVTAGPTGGRTVTKCVSYCKDSSKFNYEPGTTYVYDYTTDVSTSLIGGLETKAGLRLTARAEVTVISSCEHQLKLKDVRLEEESMDNSKERSSHDSTRTLAKRLEQNPLRFSFQNGRIDHLCSHEEEEIWILNIKRGVISLLQNTMGEERKEEMAHEVDVTGRCLTKYKKAGNSWGGSMTIRKSRDLTSCSKRHSQMTAIQSIPYTSKSPNQNLPLMAGTLDCTQTVRNKKIEKVQCSEVHTFAPLERENNGALTTVSQTLVYSSEKKASTNFEDFTMRKATLLFEVPSATEAKESDITQVLEILKELKDETVPEVRKEAPQYFIDLVESLRLIGYSGLKALYSRAPVGSKKAVLDAMPLVGTAPALAFMRDLLIEKQINEAEAEAWLTSLAFIKYPQLEMISALRPLINEEPKSQALFGISALINTYCSENQGCRDQRPVQEILTKIVSLLGPSCRVSGPERTQVVILALKALGNAGRLPNEEDHQSYNVLRHCFQETHNAMEIRLAALDAFRRMPCDHYDQTPVLALYKNMKEHTEVRIKAYLTAMKCADREVIDIVKETMYADAVNQVGSFVWTHLTNLQETSSPDKQQIRELISNDFLRNKFNTDARKFSRNYEGSAFWEDLNIGGSVDANVIFSPESFLPRSGMINITTHMFGEAVNLVEFGGRAQALEVLLEPIFGPNGYFPDPSISDALQSMRGKREISDNKLERLGSLYHQASREKDMTPGISVYTRIFGHEIMAKNFEISDKASFPSLVDEEGTNWLDITRLFDNLSSGKSIEYTKSAVILDATYSVTTSAGIPLTLGVQAASTVGITAKGKVNLAKFIESRELEIEGLVQPSGSLQINGILSVAIGQGRSGLKSGIKFQNSLHSATNMEGEIKMKGAKIIHAEIKLPQKKQEIFKASSQLLILRLSKEVVEVRSNERSKFQHKMCTPSGISTLFGIQLCGEIDVPETLRFPFLSPATAEIYLEKTDSFTNYEFDYKFDNEDSVISLKTTFNTPGSSIDRRLALDFLLDPINGKLEAGIETPRSSVKAEGIYTPAQQNLQLEVKNDKEQVLLISTSLRKQGSRAEPNFFIAYHRRPIIEIDGAFDISNLADVNGKANFDLNIKEFTKMPIKINGDLNRNGDSYNTNFGIDSHLLTGNVRSTMKLREGLYSTKSTVDYSWKKKQSKTMDISGKVQTSKTGFLTKLIASANVIVPQNPEYSFDFALDSQKSPGFLENTLQLSLGRSTFEGKTIYNLQNTQSKRELNLLLSLLAPKQGIDYHVEYQHESLDSGVMAKFTGRTDPKKEIRGKIEYAIGKENLVDKELNGALSWPNTDYSFKSSFKEVQRGEFEGEMIIHPNRDPDMKVHFTFKNKPNKDKLDMGFEFMTRGMTKAPVSGSMALFVNDNQCHFDGLVLIEGNGKYRGRWSTSMDYTTKKNMYKLEGKVTLNERKYSGDMTLKRTKSGDFNGVLDLQLKKHIVLEAKLNGIKSGATSGEVTLYMDRDADPSKKMKIEALVDHRSLPMSINVRANCFGKQVAGNGKYGHGKFEIEGTWMNDQSFAIVVEAPEFTFDKTILDMKITSSFDELKDVSLMIRHHYTGYEIDTEIKTIFGEKISDIRLMGLLAIPESRFSASFDLTGMKKLEGKIRIGSSSGKQIFEAIGKRGVDEKSILVQYENKHNRGFNGKIIFSGSKQIPKIFIELVHENDLNLKSELAIEWSFPSKNPKQITLLVQGNERKDGQSYKALIRTPWKKLENLEGYFNFNFDHHDKVIEMSLNGSYDLLPIGAKYILQGTMKDFHHDTKVYWTKNTKREEIKLVGNGHINGFWDTEIKSTFEFNKKSHPIHYQLNLVSIHQEGSQKVQIEGFAYDQRAATGLSWKTRNSLELSGFAIIPNQPKLAFNIVQKKVGKGRELEGSVLIGEKEMGKFGAQVEFDGLMKWNLRTIIRSELEMIPHITLKSKHLIEDFTDIIHETEISFSGDNVRQWGGKNEQKMGVEVHVKDGQHWDAAVMWGEKEEMRIEGEWQYEKDWKKVKLEMTSPFFEKIEGEGELKSSDGVEINFSSTMKGHRWFTLKSHGKTVGGKLMGEFDLHCPYGHDLLGKALIDYERNNMEITLKETHQKLIDLVIRGQITRKAGNVRLQLDSSLHNYLKNLMIGGEYKLEGSTLKAEAIYEIVGKKSSATYIGQWSDGEKRLTVVVEGEKKSSLDLQVVGINKLKGSTTFNDRRIGKFEIEYKQEGGDFQLGKYILKIHAEGERSSYDGSIILGLDMNKFLIEIGTPFDNWREMSLIGKMDFDSTPFKMELAGRRGNDNMQFSIEGDFNGNNKKFLIRGTTPFRGFTRVHTEALLKITKNNWTFDLEGNVEQKNVKLSGTWSNKKIEGEIKTPFEVLEIVKFVTVYDISNRDSRKVEMKVQWNEKTYEILSTLATPNIQKGESKIIFVIPDHRVILEGKYDFTRDYRFQGAFETQSMRKEIGAVLVLRQNEITFEITTPISGFEKIEGSGKVEGDIRSIRGRHQGVLEFRMNGNSNHVAVSTVFEDKIYKMTVETPIRNWEKIRIELEHDFHGSQKKILAMADMGHQRKAQFLAKTILDGKLWKLEESGKASFEIEMTTPLDNFEEMKLEGKIERDASSYTGSWAYTRNGKKLNGRIEGKLERKDMFIAHLAGELDAELYDIKPMSGKGHLKFDFGGLGSLKLEGIHDGQKHAVDASVRASRSEVEIKIDTSYRSLKNIQLKGKIGREGEYQAIFQINENKYEINGVMKIDGIENTKFSLQGKTPYEGLGSINAEAWVRSQSGSLTSQISFQHDGNKYGAKLEGIKSRDGGELKLHLASPIHKWEQIICSASYSMNRNNRNALFSLQKNSKEILTGELKFRPEEIEMKILSKFLVPIDGKMNIGWTRALVPLRINIDIKAGHKGHKIYMISNIVTLTSGDLSIDTSFRGWEKTKINWALQGELNEGQIKLMVDLPKWSEKSLMGSWRSESWMDVNIEGQLRLNPHEKEMAYGIKWSLVPEKHGNGKMSTSLTYTLNDEEKEIQFTTALKNKNNMRSVELSLITPFKLIQEASINAKFSKAEKSFEMSSSFNKEILLTSNGIFDVKPMLTRVKINLNVPKLMETVNINWSHDISSHTNTLDASFVQARKELRLKGEATIPSGKNEFEISANVVSTIPRMTINTRGTIRGGIIQEDGRNRLVFVVDCQDIGLWKIDGHLGSSNGIVGKLDFESPIPQVPSFKSQMSWIGVIDQRINGEISVQVGRHEEMRGRMMLSKREIDASFQSGIRGLENLGLVGKAHWDDKIAELKVTVGDKMAEFEGKMNIKSNESLRGSIKTRSSWDIIPDGSFDIKVSRNGQLEISGGWGDKTVSLVGTMRSSGKSLLMSADSQLTVSINSREKWKIKTNHYFKNGQYSFNATIGDQVMIESFLQTLEDKVISTRIQWAPKKVITVRLEAEDGRFSAEIDTPWTHEIRTTGHYRKEREVYTARGTYVTRGVESGLGGTFKMSSHSLEGTFNVNIPILESKVEGKMELKKVRDGAFKGIVDMTMNKKRFEAEGSMSTTQGGHSNSMVEHDIKFTMSLPSRKMKTLGGEISVRRPKNSFANMEVITVVNCPSGTSKLVLNYELPLKGQILIDSHVLSSPIKMQFEALKVDFRHFEGSVQVQDNEISLTWDMRLPRFNIDLNGLMPTLLRRPLSFKLQTEGTFDITKGISLTSTGSWKKEYYNFEMTLEREMDQVKCLVSLHSPTFSHDKKEMSIKIRKVESGSYEFIIFGENGKKFFDANGEITMNNGWFKVVGKTGGFIGVHFIDMGMVNSEIEYGYELTTESNLLKGKKFQTKAMLKRTDWGWNGEITCNTRKAKHSIVTSVYLEDKMISLQIESPLVDPISINIEQVKTHRHIIEGKIMAVLMGKTHQVSALLNKAQWEGKVKVLSPLLPSQHLNIHGKWVKVKDHFSMVGEISAIGSTWRLEGTHRFNHVKDMEVKFEIMTPFKSFDRLTLGGKLSADEASIEMFTPLQSLPDIMLSLSGIPLFEEIRMDKFKPQLTIQLPWFTYFISGAFVLPGQTRKGDIRFVFEKIRKSRNIHHKYQAGIEIPSLEKIMSFDSPKARLYIQTPTELMKHLEVEVKLHVIKQARIEFTMRGDLNGKVMRLFLKNSWAQGPMRLIAELKTPFKQHEKYLASLRIDDYNFGVGKNILIELQKDGMKEPIRTEVDYKGRYNGLMDMGVEIMIDIPIMKDSTKMPLTLKLDSTLKNGKYMGIIEGIWASYHPVLRAEAGLTESRLFGNVEVKVHRYHGKTFFEIVKMNAAVNFNAQLEVQGKVWLDSKGIVSIESNMIDSSFVIVTPLDIFQSSTLTLRVSPLPTGESFSIIKMIKDIDVHTGLTYNGQKIIQLQLVNRQGKRSLEIHNPIRPVSLTLTFEKESKKVMSIVGEFCWNLRKPIESTVGMEITIDENDDGKDLTFKLQGGERGNFEGYCSCYSSSSKDDKSLKIKWNRPLEKQQGEIGLSWILLRHPSANKKYELVSRLDTPWRSIEFVSHVLHGEKKEHLVELRWDAKRDMSKKMAGKMITERMSSKRNGGIKHSIAISHPSFDNDLVVSLEKNYKNNNLRSATIMIQPTTFPEDDITIQFAQISSNWKEMEFLVSQPATNIELKTNLKNKGPHIVVVVSYMDVRGEKHGLKIESIVEKSRRMISVQGGQHEVWSDILRMDLQKSRDSVSMMVKTNVHEARIFVKKDLPLLDVSVTMGSGRKIFFMAGLPHEREITVKVYHEHFGKTSIDALASIKLNTTQILSSKLFWRPDLIEDLSQLAIDKSNKNIVTTIVSSDFFNYRVKDEFVGRLGFIEPAWRKFMEEFHKFSREQLSGIMDELRMIGNVVKDLYNNNALYMKDAYNMMKDGLIFIRSSFAKLFNAMTNVFGVVGDIFGWAFDWVKEKLGGVFRFWDKWSGKLEDFFMPILEEIERFIERIWKEYFGHLAQTFEKMVDMYDALVEAIDGKIEKLEQKIAAIGVVKKAFKLYNEYASWIQELPIQDYLDKIELMIVKRIFEPIEKHYNYYFVSIKKAFEEGNYISILEMPPIPYIRHVSMKLGRSIGKFWTFIEAEQMIKDLFRQLLKNVDQMIQRHIPTASWVWETEKGHIEYHQSLGPMEWEDFTKIPEWRRSEEDQADLSRMSDFYYQMLDNLRNAKPVFDLNLREILPPFGAHAVMAGDYHYYTFDKKYFRFAGECSYVLAVDLLHNNFSMIVNYENHEGDLKKKSYTLVSDKRHIEIEVKGLKVLLDNKKVDLPIQVGPTFIRRQPSGIEIIDTRGFHMSCSLSPSICTVSVSGWYFGKLAGLLGTYDNEETNDMRTPNGQILDDVSTFAHTWRVGKNSNKCKVKNFARKDNERTDVEGICKQHFEDKSSPLRPCFNEIPTGIFNDMCKYDTSINVNSAMRKEAACTAFGAYVAECQKSGIDIWMPPSCVRCKLENGQAMTSGENITLESNDGMAVPSSADVIVLLEEASCNEGIPVGEMMNKLDVALKAQGLKDNLFALVGFGGEGAHNKPHIRTLSSQVWSHSTLFKIAENIPKDGSGQGDLYEAIEFAATLGFRAGVSKTMIAITCGSDKCGDNRRYPDVLTLLRENDLKLHMLSAKEFTLKNRGERRSGKEEEISKIYGIDSTGVYTIKQAKQHAKADKSLRRQINLPKDLCTPLAMETNGTRFTTKRLSKKFVEVWSKRVAETATPSECQRCECVPNKDGGANFLCHQCVSPNLQPFLDEWERFKETGDLNEEENNGPEFDYDVNNY